MMRPNDGERRRNNPPSHLAHQDLPCELQDLCCRADFYFFPTKVPPFLSALSVLSAQPEGHCLKSSFLPKGANEELVLGTRWQYKHGTTSPENADIVKEITDI